jgi:hypothetical protein
VTESCARCAKTIDLEIPGSCRVGAHGRPFCSMVCADAWEKDPANTDVVAESYRRANCSAYLSCVHDAIMLNVSLDAHPRFASCDAECPLRR